MNKKILILGCTGILGNALFRTLSIESNLSVFGTYRNNFAKKYFSPNFINNLIKLDDVNNNDELIETINKVKPKVVINAISLSSDKFSEIHQMLSIFSLLPKRLNILSQKYGFRLIQISSDGVFSGLKGQYKEIDLPDAKDEYGKCKILGELYGTNCLTIRTSIIGPDLYKKNGLLSWFLKQEKSCSGFSNVIFSGFPTIIFSEIIRDQILPREDIFGIYHISSTPISKFKLLTMISSIYNKKIIIKPLEIPYCNRSLNSDKFFSISNFELKDWNHMIKRMFKDHLNILKYDV